MSCTDGGYSDDQHDIIQDKLAFLTEMLRNLCNKVEKRGMIDLFNSDTRNWWVAHIRADAKRIKKLQKQKKEIQEREALLNKLTQYERKLLGMD